MKKKEILQKFLEEANDFLGKNLTSDDNKFKAWNHSLIRFLEAEFGKNSTTTNLFTSRTYTLTVFFEAQYSQFVEAFEDDLKTTIEDLKRLIDEVDDDNFKVENSVERIPKESPIAFNIVNNNTNTNTSSSSVNELIILKYEEIKEEIENNTFLDDESKKVLIDKLNEIEKIKNSSESKSKKWNMAKSIFTFVLDKGADIAIMFIPKILEAISK